MSESLRNLIPILWAMFLFIIPMFLLYLYEIFLWPKYLCILLAIAWFIGSSAIMIILKI
jgi:hypothetical protein